MVDCCSHRRLLVLMGGCVSGASVEESTRTAKQGCTPIGIWSNRSCSKANNHYRGCPRTSGWALRCATRTVSYLVHRALNTQLLRRARRCRQIDTQWASDLSKMNNRGSRQVQMVTAASRTMCCTISISLLGKHLRHHSTSTLNNTRQAICGSTFVPAEVSNH